jgi:hypothetical protein
VTDLHAWITQQVDECERPWPLPDGVRHRLEADRRILARHCLDPAKADSWMFAAACMGCGTEGTFEEPVAENINDCPELLDLAHAHGITDEILARLDRPQTPEPTPAQKRRLRERARLIVPITTSDVPEALRGHRWERKR